MTVLRLIIYGNLLVSFSAGILTFGVSTYQGFQMAHLLGVCAFFATLFIYNLQRLMRFDHVKIQQSARHTWLVKNKSIMVFFCVSGVFGAIISYIFLGIESDLLLIIGLSIIGFLYAFSGLNIKALREVPIIKIYLISAVWALVSVFWPAFRQDDLNQDTILLMFSVGFYVFAATIPFDIRDLIYDSASQKTIPQLVGVNFSRILGIASLLTSGLLMSFTDVEFLYNLLFYFAYTGMGVLILLSTTDKKEMFFSGLIDGWIIVLGMALTY